MSSTGYYDQSYPPSLWIPVPPPPPRLVSLAPSTGVISTLVSVVITGTDFPVDSVVRAGSTVVPSTRVSATEIDADVTLPGTAGPITIRVESATTGNSNQLPFTVTATAGFAAIPVDNPPPETTEEPTS